MTRGGAKGKALFLEEINGLEQQAPELSIGGAHPDHTGSEWGGHTSEGSPTFIKGVSLSDVREHTHTHTRLSLLHLLETSMDITCGWLIPSFPKVQFLYKEEGRQLPWGGMHTQAPCGERHTEFIFFCP